MKVSTALLLAAGTAALGYYAYRKFTDVEVVLDEPVVEKPTLLLPAPKPEKPAK